MFFFFISKNNYFYIIKLPFFPMEIKKVLKFSLDSNLFNVVEASTVIFAFNTIHIPWILQNYGCWQ